MAGGRFGDIEVHDSIGDGIKLGEGNDDGEKALWTSGGVGGVGDGGTKFNAGGGVGRVSLSKLEMDGSIVENERCGTTGEKIKMRVVLFIKETTTADRTTIQIINNTQYQSYLR